jgi:hypothetical protein
MHVWARRSTTVSPALPLLDARNRGAVDNDADVGHHAPRPHVDEPPALQNGCGIRRNCGNRDDREEQTDGNSQLRTEN